MFCFAEDGSLLVRRNFTSAEISAKTATFALPGTSAGKSVEFYVLANTSVGDVATKSALLALTETTPQNYNGIFQQVSTSALRPGGFLMSGSATKTVVAGSNTSVPITLKRDVAKVAVQTSLSSDFSAKYPGKVKINSVTLSRAAAQTPYFAGTLKTGAMSFTHSQLSTEASGKYNNLFYCYENGALGAGSRVLLTLEGVYDMDGNFSTTNDQTPVSYETELAGASDNGQLVRNGYYRVGVSIAGLTGQSVGATITVADWETPTTQTINLGQ